MTQGASGKPDRAATPSGPSPSVSGIAGIPSAEDIAFTRWFTHEEGFHFRCERFAEECLLEDGYQYQVARRWLRAAFQVGFEAAVRQDAPESGTP